MNAIDPGVAPFDDPTRDVDIGAQADMHARIGQMARAGRIVGITSGHLAEQGLPNTVSTDRLSAISEAA